MYRTIDAVVDILKKWKIETIFGCPGTTEIPFLESIKSNSKIEYITAYLDGLAVGLADGYARATGKVAITNLHATQGTLNAYGFVRVALRDESPIVIISGLPSHSYELVEPTHFIYGIADILRRVTKWSWQINSPEQIYVALNRAIKIAQTPPYGPTFLGIPQDLMVKKVNKDKFTLHRCEESVVVASDDKIKKFTNFMIKARNPLILAGKRLGDVKAQLELNEMSKRIAAPVVSEAPDRGPQIYTVHMSHDNPMYLGFYSNRNNLITKQIKESDLIIEIGCKQTYPRIIKEINSESNVIQLQEGPKELGKYHSIKYGLCGDIKQNMIQINKVLQEHRLINKEQINNRIKEISKIILKHKIPRREEIKNIRLEGNTIKPKHLIKAMIENIPEDAVFIDEAQSFSWFIKQYFPFTQKHTAYGTNASHIGWGLPFSTGVSFYYKKRKTICVVSDSAFLMGIQTLGTLARYKLPIVIIVINNRGFASLKIEMQSYAKQTFKNLNELDLTACNFKYKTVTKGLGVKAYSVNKVSKLNKVLKKSMNEKIPVVIDVQCDNKNEVWEDGWFKAPPK